MRVWLNHWFSTAYRIIEMIKNNEDNQEFYIIGTNDKKDCVYKKVCDEFYVELFTPVYIIIFFCY